MVSATLIKPLQQASAVTERNALVVTIITLKFVCQTAIIFSTRDNPTKVWDHIYIRSTSQGL